MKPRISLITLGVDDLERALRFYRDGLGLATQGIVGAEIEDGAVAFFDLQHGVKLALWPRKSLAKDAGVELGPGLRRGDEGARRGDEGARRGDGADWSIAHNVASREEVDAVMEEARRAGARVTKPAVETSWGGYAGYFRDPDGHLWEVAWNPQWPLEP